VLGQCGLLALLNVLGDPIRAGVFIADKRHVCADDHATAVAVSVLFLVHTIRSVATQEGTAYVVFVSLVAVCTGWVANAVTNGAAHAVLFEFFPHWHFTRAAPPSRPRSSKMTRSFAEVITFVRCSVDHEVFVACSQQQVTWDGERVSACVFAYVCLCVVRLPRLSLPSFPSCFLGVRYSRNVARSFCQAGQESKEGACVACICICDLQ